MATVRSSVCTSTAGVGVRERQVWFVSPSQPYLSISKVPEGFRGNAQPYLESAFPAMATVANIDDPRPSPSPSPPPPSPSPPPSPPPPAADEGGGDGEGGGDEGGGDADEGGGDEGGGDEGGGDAEGGGGTVPKPDDPACVDKYPDNCPQWAAEYCTSRYVYSSK